MQLTEGGVAILDEDGFVLISIKNLPIIGVVNKRTLRLPVGEYAIGLWQPRSLVIAHTEQKPAEFLYEREGWK
jgi:hypothetical protein